MRKHAVIARYQEDTRWADALAIPATVYQKGVGLPNIGFEAGTYLHHFIECYDSLSEVVVCLQGNPFPHFNGGLPALNPLLEAINPDSFSFMPLASHGAMQTRDGGPDHPGLSPSLERLWRELLGYPPPDLWYSAYGGQFAVHRNMIRRRPVEFWQRARELIVTRDDACVMERMWGGLFG